MNKLSADNPLEQKVKKLKQTSVTYKHAKNILKASLEKQDGIVEYTSAPEMAVEVLEQENTGEQPVDKALIAEHIFRKAIEDSIPGGIAGFDTDGRQIYVNRAFCEMVEWPEEALIGAKYPHPYWPPAAIQSAVADIQLLLSGNAPSDGIELLFVRRSGKEFWGLVTGTGLIDSQGQPIGYLMSVADISAQKRVEHTIRALSSRLVDRQELERKFVAQELHDGIGGKLAAVKYSIEKIITELQQKKDALQAPLQDILSIVHDTIDETQRIYRNLHPAILDDLGLNAALRSLCREFMEVYSTITIETRFEAPEKVIQDSLKILIYRIMQEALNNVAKHSGADRVEASLRLVDIENEIELVIKDNGQGFNLTDVQAMDFQQRGIGLESIKERTAVFGGALDIQTKRGQGTTLRMSWPGRR
jgi:PAS domain S-box-containing protein